MLTFRFLAGLPHGVNFSVAALVAAALAPREKRTQPVARVIARLTPAAVVGVPLANVVGQVVSWRWAFGLVAGSPCGRPPWCGYTRRSARPRPEPAY